VKNQKSIIIKKVKKHVEEGSHGGSWKVAYADFVTAMMAFFLLLWLLTMSSDEKRIRVSQYFKHFSVYTEGGTSFMGKTSEIFSEVGETKEKVFANKHGEDTSNVEGQESLLAVEYNERDARLKNIEEALRQAVIEKLGDIKDQILVDVVEGGVRIQMIDKDGSLMFELGSNKLTSKAKKVFKVIGKHINPLTNKVTIEGHTDALPYSGKDYSNWELSTERASTARRQLEKNDLDPDRIARVSGFASTDPLIKEDPADPRNRRISIILKIPKKNEKNVTSKKAGEKPPLKEDKIKKTIKKSAVKKDEFKPLVKTKQEKTATEKSDISAGKHDSGRPVSNKNNYHPVIREKLNPVVKDDDVKNPVIDNEWNPVIKITKKKPLEVIEKGIVSKKNKMEQPEAGNIRENTVTKKKTGNNTKNDTQTPIQEFYITPELMKNNKNLAVEKSENNPATKKDDLSPVIKKDTWSPVIEKDEFSPVLGND
jgi:chemotaxis protein MotB